MSELMYSVFFKDVSEMVERGEALLHPRMSDTSFRKIGRYIYRNKHNLASFGVKVLAAGLLTGGIGAAVVAGGAVVTYTGKRLYRRGQTAWHESNLAMKRSVIGEITKSQRSESSGISIEAVNYEFSLALEEIGFLCQHGSLVNIMNAFAELDADAKALIDLVPNGIVPVLRSCDDAWKMMEHLERLKKRRAELADATDLLQEFIEYVVLVTSSYQQGDEHDNINSFEWRRRRALARIVELSHGSTPSDKWRAALKLLNEKANSSRVFHNRFISKDYTSWITINNPEFSPLLESFVAPLRDPVGNRYEGSGTLSTGLVTGGTGIAIGSTSLGLSTGGRVAYNAITKAGDVLTGVTTASKGLAGSALNSVASSGVSSGVGVVSDALFSSLQRYVDLRKLAQVRASINEKFVEDDRAARDASGRRLTALEIFSGISPEAVAALRKAAKEIMSTTAKKVAHLVEADQEFNLKMNSGDRAAIAEILMRRQKLKDQVAALTPVLFMFYEATVMRGTQLINVCLEMEPSINRVVKEWIVDHNRGTGLERCTWGCTVCYMEAAKALPYEVGLDFRHGPLSPQIQRSILSFWWGRPLHPGPTGMGGLRAKVDRNWAMS